MAKLTDKNREVLRLMLQGLTAKEIGDRLGCSYRTVDYHREQIYKVTGVPNIVALTHVLYRTAISKNARHDIGSGISVCNAFDLLEEVRHLERLA
jgi:DNA-binding CsgD family transcriptional regulator